MVLHSVSDVEVSMNADNSIHHRQTTRHISLRMSHQFMIQRVCHMHIQLLQSIMIQNTWNLL